jgi:histidine triad (HIT) family protein
MKGCVFCSIVKGEAPADLVYEDEDVIAFMDIHPATRGHVLIAPRRHAIDLSDVPIKDARAVMDAAINVAGMLTEALRPEGVNLFVSSGRAAWQTVFHFHLHVLPRFAGDSLVPPWSPDQPRGDPKELAAIAARIRGASRPDRQEWPGR